MKLSDLLGNLEYALLRGSLDTQVDALTADSRKAKKNSAFVCIVGAVSDGHTYIESVLQAGASVIVVQNDRSFCVEEIKQYEGITVVSVKNTRYALAELSAAYFGYPAKELFTIGITGTKGKTTTTYMIREALEACGIETGLIGTIEIIIGKQHIPADRTTPESYMIQESFRKMVDAGCRAVVMEVSSQGLKLDRTAGIFFDIGVFTNLQPDHIGPNEHDSFEEYMACKAKLFQQCKLGIVNADDVHTKEIIAGCRCPIETYGVVQDAQIRASQVKLLQSAGTIGLAYHCSGLVETDIELNMPGLFSVYNSLCAIAVTRHLSVAKEAVKEALRQVQVKGRTELVQVSERFTVMIDYAHNAMALESLLATLREYQPNRLMCVFGCGGNRDRGRRFEMGEVSGNLADFTVITSDNPRFEEPEAIIEDIKTAIHKTKGSYIAIVDRKEAIKYAIAHGQAGDIIVIAGKGHEDYQEIRGVKYPMNERALIDEVVLQLKDEGWEA